MSDATTLPTDLHQLRVRAAQGEQFDFLFFWGHQVPEDGVITKSCLSQWYPASFTVKGLLYPTAEHWMMAEKARLFGDHEAAEMILAAATPKAAKAMGRKVKNFDEKVWGDCCREIVTRGNVEKFRQNEALLHFLISTTGNVLVEASPRDRIWGIGLRQDDPRAMNPALWRGTNSLGFAPLAVQAELSGLAR